VIIPKMIIDFEAKEVSESKYYSRYFDNPCRIVFAFSTNVDKLNHLNCYLLLYMKHHF
jgi:hypothetical protein